MFQRCSAAAALHKQCFLLHPLRELTYLRLLDPAPRSTEPEGVKFSYCRTSQGALS